MFDSPKLLNMREALRGSLVHKYISLFTYLQGVARSARSKSTNLVDFIDRVSNRWWRLRSSHAFETRDTCLRVSGSSWRKSMM